MSIATAILGNSGTGKTASLRNFDPKRVALIQSIPKPLPFKNPAWKESIFVTDNANQIIAGLNKTEKEIVIIDDFQYILSNEFMRRSSEKSFDKFNDIGNAGWSIFNAAINSKARVYILAHTAMDEYGGNIRLKTIGKLLDDKIVLEGMLTIVLRTHVEGGKYFFSTVNNGSDTVKAPMGMFKESLINNDLNEVDNIIERYYEEL